MVRWSGPWTKASLSISTNRFCFEREYGQIRITTMHQTFIGLFNWVYMDWKNKLAVYNASQTLCMEMSHTQERTDWTGNGSYYTVFHSRSMDFPAIQTNYPHILAPKSSLQQLFKMFLCIVYSTLICGRYNVCWFANPSCPSCFRPAYICITNCSLL